MHVELPKAKKFREFGGEYVMIVISIITALGLEHAVQTHHQRHLAQEASERMEAELRDDKQELDVVLKHNEDMRARVEKLRADFLDDLKRGTPDQAAIDRMFARDKRAFNLAIHVPTLRHEAWDVAVANQAASFIAPDKLQRYASLYAHIQQVDRIASGAGNKFLDGAEMISLVSDLDIGKANARDMLRLLKQMEVSYVAEDGNLINLRDDLADGLEAKPVTTARR